MAEGPSIPAGEWSVVWARGHGCPELADLLAGGRAIRTGPDLRASCVEARADLLVGRRLIPEDLVSLAVPYDFQPAAVRAVVAAVAGGPHSRLAAGVAQRLSAALDVPVSLLAVSPEPGADSRAWEALERAGDGLASAERSVRRAANPGAAVRALPPGSLLVLGASEGTWWRRHLAAPGRQLRLAAPAGAVVVRHAPPRCFRIMEEPVAMGLHMPAGEARRLTDLPVLPVAEEGRLVGLVHRRRLDDADPAQPLSHLMEAPRAVQVDDPLEAAAALAVTLDGTPVPVIDSGGRLRGLVRPGPAETNSAAPGGAHAG
ncbi:MAG: hypothetical protein FJW79_04495 [Actinobacteria bacterium]|nr:hypothetical protein [Actinomycetota bacterium]